MSKSKLTVGDLVKFTAVAKQASFIGNGTAMRHTATRLEESGLSEAQHRISKKPYWIHISIDSIGLILKDVGERRKNGTYQFLVLFDEIKVFVDDLDVEEHV